MLFAGICIVKKRPHAEGNIFKSKVTVFHYTVNWIFVISHPYCVCLMGLGTISSGYRQAAERDDTSEIIV